MVREQPPASTQLLAYSSTGNSPFEHVSRICRSMGYPKHPRESILWNFCSNDMLIIVLRWLKECPSIFRWRLSREQSWTSPAAKSSLIAANTAKRMIKPMCYRLLTGYKKHRRISFRTPFSGKFSIAVHACARSYCVMPSTSFWDHRNPAYEIDRVFELTIKEQENTHLNRPQSIVIDINKKYDTPICQRLEQAR